MDVSSREMQLVATTTPTPSDTSSQNDHSTLRVLNYKAPSKHGSKRNQRRASRACLACRARKIRCDVTLRQPCGNCQWNGKECTVRKHARYRNQSDPVGEACSRASGSPRNLEFCKTQNNERARSHERQTTIDSTSSPICNSKSPSSPSTSYSPVSLSEHNAAHTTSPAEWNQAKRFPRFIKPFGKTLDHNDWEFLCSKQALTLPSPPVQAALIRSYLEHVQPLLPVLNVDQFLQSFNARSGQLSLLLFQCVMFAGSAFVDIALLIDDGFQTRSEARLAFFERARILYDFGCEKDSLQLVQALLLMTVWHDVPNKLRDVSHWVDVAISQAFAAELHLEPASIRPELPQKVQKFRRRLWWLCFIRDRLTCLGQERPPRIRDGDFDVKIVGLTDFELDESYTCPSTLSHSLGSYMWDKNKREEIARLCIALAKLCICVSVPPLDQSAFEYYQRNLLGWYASLSRSEHFRLTAERSQYTDACPGFHCAMLHVIYHKACLVLYRARLSALSQQVTASQMDLELLKIDMQHSVCRLEEITSNLEEFQPIRFISTLEMMFTVPAADVDFIAIGRSQKESSCRCTQIMDSMEELGSISSPGELSDNSDTTLGSSPATLWSDDGEVNCSVLTDDGLLRSLFKDVFMDELIPLLQVDKGKALLPEQKSKSNDSDCRLEGLGLLYDMFLHS